MSGRDKNSSVGWNHQIYFQELWTNHCPWFLQHLRNEMKLASEVKASSVRQGEGKEHTKLQRLQPQPVTIITDVPRVPTVLEGHGAHGPESEGVRDHCERKLQCLSTVCAGTSVASFHPDKNKRQKEPRLRHVFAQEEHVRWCFFLLIGHLKWILEHAHCHMATLENVFPPNCLPFLSTHQGHPPMTSPEKSPCSVSSPTSMSFLKS